MNFYTTRSIGLMAALLLIFNVAALTAQEKSTVKLLDKGNALAIVGATFEYGNQNGVSDESGNIQFEYEPGLSIYFSHINYGKWSLDDNGVLSLIQQKVLYRQNSIVNLYPVTVIALRPNKSPVEKLELDYQERMAHDAAAVLNQNPALNSIRKGGGYGFDPVFRGFKYDQLNIVLNGAQSATAACPNRMDPPTSQMAPNMIDRIEVLKGPHALRYGTGFGATINFVPVALRFTEEQDTYGRVSSGYEGNGAIFRTEGQLGFSGKNHDVALFGSWSQGEDYTSGNGQIIDGEFNRGSFGTNLGFKLSEDSQLRVSAIYNVARDADFPALPMDLRKDDTWMFNARHDITFDKDHLSSWNTTIFASFVDHLMDNLLKPLDPRMLNAATNAKTSNYGGRSEGIWNFDASNLFAGLDFRSEGAQGIRTREFLMGPNAGNIVKDNAWQDGRIDKTAVFGAYHLNFEKIRFVLSTRLELNSADINDPAPEFSLVFDDAQVTQFNPSISLGATQNIAENVTMGLWLGRAQRSAGLTERFINYFPVGQDPFELIGNPLLNPEINNQLDLTFNWRKNSTNLNIDLFAGYLQDFISSVIDPSLTPRIPTSPGVRQFVNIDNAFKAGFEVNWTQELVLGLQQRVGMAYTYAQDLERDEPLPEIAPLDFRYTLIGNYNKGKLQPELTFRHVLEQSRISTEYGETNTPSFSLLDVKLAYELTDAARITLGVNNIFDDNYYEHLARSVRGNNLPIFAPGRNAFAAINFVF